MELKYNNFISKNSIILLLIIMLIGAYSNEEDGITDFPTAIPTKNKTNDIEAYSNAEDIIMSDFEIPIYYTTSDTEAYSNTEDIIMSDFEIPVNYTTSDIEENSDLEDGVTHIPTEIPTNIITDAIEENYATTYNNNKREKGSLILIIVIISGVVVLAFIIIVIIFLYKKKIKKTPDIPNENNTTEIIINPNPDIIMKEPNEKDITKCKIKVIFDYNQDKCEIYAEPETTMKEILDMYFTKKNIQKKNKFFLYGGDRISTESNNSKIKEFNKNNDNTVTILVNDNIFI